MKALTKEQNEQIEKIKRLKKEKDAIILVHNYQRPEIYEVADYIGDSLGLCVKAQEMKAKIIVFCGVHFMAESAAVMNPDKKVLLPALDAGCALADMITAEALIKEQAKYPEAATVCYVNSTADVKAASDICCTSSNAVEVVKSLPNKQILMVPDKNLASFVAKQLPDKEIIAWDGFCPIHHKITAPYILEAKKKKPNAKILAHPECRDEVLQLSDFVGSTEAIVKFATEDDGEEYIVLTECGMIQRLMKENSNKKFYTVCGLCYDMKKITLERIINSLENEEYEITVPFDIAVKARESLDKMFLINKKNKQILLPVNS